MSTPMETIMTDADAPAIQTSELDEATLSESGFYWRDTPRGVKVLVCKPLEDAGFVNGFSTRLAGVSPFPEQSLNLAGFNEDAADNIYENRRRFLEAFSGEYRLALAWQVHGSSIRMVRDEGDVGDSDIRADAVLSN